MKKILTSIVTVVFVLSALLPNLASAQETAEKTFVQDVSYEYRREECELLVALSVVSEEQVSKGTEANTVTRGEIADILAVLSVNSGAPTTIDGYTDVEKSHTNYNGISWATGLGLMNGYGDGTFRPDNPITYNELSTVLLKLLGYNMAVAQSNIDAFATASTLKLFNKTQDVIGRDILVSRVNLVTVIYNAVHTDLMKQQNYGTDETYSVAYGCTILTENFKVYSGMGIISKNQYTALSAGAKPAPEGCVTIDNIDYLTGDTGADELLGYSVRFYCQTNLSGRVKNKLLYVSAEGLNTVLTIDAEDIVKPIDKSNITTVKYYDDKYNVKDEIIPASTDFLYNDFPAAITSDTMDIDSGSITFVNNGSTNDWSVVKVEDYQVLTVERSDTVSGVIYSKYNNADDLTYDPDELYKSVFFYDRDGNPADPNIVREWYVLSVKKDLQGKKVSAYMTVDEFSGKVTGKGDNTIFIDEKEYEINPWIDVDSEPDCKVSVGQNYLFYKDRWGKIASVRPITSTELSYAYLIAVKSTFEICEVMIFDTEGNVSPKEINKKLVVDEKTFKTPDSQKKILEMYIGQVIRMKFDESGKVSKIYTAGGDGSDFREIPVTDGYNYRTGIIGKDYAIKDNTISFYIPNSGNMEKYVIQKGKYSMPEDYVKINAINAYALNDKFTIDILIRKYDDDEAYYNTGTRYPFVRDAQPYIVEKVSTAWDEKIGEITRIAAWHRGNRTVLTVVNDVVMKNVSPVTGYYAAQSGEKIPANYCATLKKGDLVRLNWNFEARIRALELVYSYDEDKTQDNIYVPDVNLAAAPNNGIVTPYKTVRGYIDEIADGFFRLYPATGDTSTINENVYNLYPYTQGNVTVFDTKTGEIYRGNLTDALTYKVAGEDADRVVMYSTYGTVQAVYIYK